MVRGGAATDRECGGEKARERETNRRGSETEGMGETWKRKTEKRESDNGGRERGRNIGRESERKRERVRAREKELQRESGREKAREI